MSMQQVRWVINDVRANRRIVVNPLDRLLIAVCLRQQTQQCRHFGFDLRVVVSAPCQHTPESQQLIVQQFRYSAHGRPHVGAIGVSNPLENWMKNQKAKTRKKQQLHLRAIRAGRCRERRYSDHIFIEIYFSMHHFVVKFFKIFFASGGKRAVTHITKIPRTFLTLPLAVLRDGLIHSFIEYAQCSAHAYKYTVNR